MLLVEHAVEVALGAIAAPRGQQLVEPALVQPVGCGVVDDVRTRAPSPVLGRLREPGGDGVPRDVADGDGQVRVVSDGGRAVAAAEEVSGPAVPSIELLGVRAVKLSHAVPEIGLTRLDEQMDVVVHQAVGETPPPLVLRDALEESEVSEPVEVVREDPFLVVAASEDVSDPRLVLVAWTSGHATQSPDGPPSRPLRGTVPQREGTVPRCEGTVPGGWWWPVGRG